MVAETPTYLKDALCNPDPGTTIFASSFVVVVVVLFLN